MSAPAVSASSEPSPSPDAASPGAARTSSWRRAICSPDSHEDSITSLTRPRSGLSSSVSSPPVTGSRLPSGLSSMNMPARPWPDRWTTSHPVPSATASASCSLSRPVLQGSQLDPPSCRRQLLHQPPKLMLLFAQVQRRGPVREAEQAEYPHRMSRRPLPWRYRTAIRVRRASWRVDVDDQRHALHRQRAVTDARQLKRQEHQIRRRTKHQPNRTRCVRHQNASYRPEHTLRNPVADCRHDPFFAKRPIAERPGIVLEPAVKIGTRLVLPLCFIEVHLVVADEGSTRPGQRPPPGHPGGRRGIAGRRQREILHESPSSRRSHGSSFVQRGDLAAVYRTRPGPGRAAPGCPAPSRLRRCGRYRKARSSSGRCRRAGKVPAYIA